MFWREGRFIAPTLALRVCVATVFAALLVSFSPVLAQADVVDDIKALLKQAQKENRKGHTDEAEKIYRKVIAANPNNTDAQSRKKFLDAKLHGAPTPVPMPSGPIRNPNIPPSAAGAGTPAPGKP